ncbi:MULTISPECIES: hypothetical protein [unclassified Oceanobacillus]|nr:MULTISPECIES: hypothetical protein [unclassified Oceanobacillus]
MPKIRHQEKLGLKLFDQLFGKETAGFVVIVVLNYHYTNAI